MNEVANSLRTGANPNEIFNEYPHAPIFAGKQREGCYVAILSNEQHLWSWVCCGP